VEVHLFDVRGMNGRFGLRQSREDGLGAVCRAGGQVGAIDHLENAAEVTVGLIAVGRRDAKERSADAASLNGLGGCGEPIDAELGQLARDCIDIGAGVDQRSDDHVTGSAGKAVKIGNGHIQPFPPGPPRPDVMTQCRNASGQMQHIARRGFRQPRKRGGVRKETL
jgi:hypothetical protein